ncbi:hypothetical protein ACX8XN_19425 [Calditrichota bacterium GD2]
MDKQEKSILLFDYLFIISIGWEWLAIFLLFLLKGRLIGKETEDNLKQKAWASALISGLFLGVIFFKMIHLAALAYPLQQKFLNHNLVVLLSVYFLWQLVVMALFFWLLMQLSLKKNYQYRVELSLTQKLFAGLILLAVWDIIGAVVLYWLLMSELSFIYAQMNSLPLAADEPSRQIWILLGLITSFVMALFANWLIKKSVKKNNLLLYGVSYLILTLFCLTVIFYYRGLVFPDVENLFNQFYLFWTAFVWIIIFLFGAIIFLLMIQMYYNKKYLKSGFQYRFLMYRMSQLHLVSEAGMALILLIPVIFFIYF